MNSELSADLTPGERDPSLHGDLDLERLYERLSRELDLERLRDLLLVYDLDRSSVRRDLDLLDLLLVLERVLDLLLRLDDNLELLRVRERVLERV